MDTTLCISEEPIVGDMPTVSGGAGEFLGLSRKLKTVVRAARNELGEVPELWGIWKADSPGADAGSTHL